MGDGVDLMPSENVVHKRRVADIADNECRRVLDRRAEPCRKIIEDDNLFAGVEEGQHHGRRYNLLRLLQEPSCRHPNAKSFRDSSATWRKATFLSH
jgi:hypothetical protein